MQSKLKQLKDNLEALAPGVVAVSGGLDSRVLAALAWGWGLDFTPVHLLGPHVPAAESQAALDWIRAQDKEPVVLRVNPLDIAQVAGNDKLRCYHCKRAMFAAVQSQAARLGRANVLEGTQASDAGAYRPGRQALAELGIHSPLADAGLTKPDLRSIARQRGMADPDQSARPCLLTRFEYGLHATTSLLERLGAAEAELAAAGLADFRIRIHADGRTVLQIQPGYAPDKSALLATLATHGFSSASILYTPTVSGYFD